MDAGRRVNDWLLGRVPVRSCQSRLIGSTFKEGEKTHTHTHPHTHTSQQHVTTSRRNLRTNLLISATIFRRCVCVCVCLAFCFVSFRLNALAGSLNHLEMLHKQIPIYTHTEKGRICQHNWRFWSLWRLIALNSFLFVLFSWIISYSGHLGRLNSIPLRSLLFIYSFKGRRELLIGNHGSRLKWRVGNESGFNIHIPSASVEGFPPWLFSGDLDWFLLLLLLFSWLPSSRLKWGSTQSVLNIPGKLGKMLQMMLAGQGGRWKGGGRRRRILGWDVFAIWKAGPKAALGVDGALTQRLAAVTRLLNKHLNHIRSPSVPQWWSETTTAAAAVAAAVAAAPAINNRSDQVNEPSLLAVTTWGYLSIPSLIHWLRFWRFIVPATSGDSFAITDDWAMLAVTQALLAHSIPAIQRRKSNGVDDVAGYYWIGRHRRR